MRMFFSIIVPVFNRERTLKRCITSVLNQKFSKWELLLIDDGSNDNSLDIIHQFCNVDSRIKFFQRPPSRKKGANACRNIGIENASGKYIAFLDADDEWKSERLLNVHQFLSYRNCGALYSGGLIYNGESEFKRFSRQILADESPVDFLLSDGTFAQTSSLVVKTEIASSIKFDEDLLRNQDYDFFIRIHLVNPWLFYDNFDLVIYWLKGENRNYHFKSNMVFVEKHKGLVNNKNLLFKYFYNNWLITKKLRSDKSQYFLDEMEKLYFNVNIKNKIRYLFKDALFFYYVKRKVI